MAKGIASFEEDGIRREEPHPGESEAVDAVAEIKEEVVVGELAVAVDAKREEITGLSGVDERAARCQLTPSKREGNAHPVRPQTDSESGQEDVHDADAERHAFPQADRLGFVPPRIEPLQSVVDPQPEARDLSFDSIGRRTQLLLQLAPRCKAFRRFDLPLRYRLPQTRQLLLDASREQVKVRIHRDEEVDQPVLVSQLFAS